MRNCPYCGASRLQTEGGENGNPFDRRPEKTVCLECGRTIPAGEPEKCAVKPDISAAGRMTDKRKSAQKPKPAAKTDTKEDNL